MPTCSPSSVSARHTCRSPTSMCIDMYIAVRIDMCAGLLSGMCHARFKSSRRQSRKGHWHVFSCGAVGVADVSLNQTLPHVSLHQTSPDVSLNQTRAPSGQRACRHASQASGARGTRADRDRVRESAHARARTVSTFVKTHFNTHAYTNVDAHVSTHVKTHANVC